jgi:hypothetical protein
VVARAVMQPPETQWEVLPCCARALRQGLPVLALGVSLHTWGLRLRGAVLVLAFSIPPVLPSASSDSGRLSIPTVFGAQYPASRHPCPTLQVRRYHRPRMARGQSGSLRLPCTTLSFATPCRFIPALFRRSVSVLCLLESRSWGRQATENDGLPHETGHCIAR